MARWPRCLGKRPPAPNATIRNRVRNRKLLLERLEERLAPALAPIAVDDVATVAVNYDPVQERPLALAAVDVLANDTVVGNATYRSSITIASDPAFGSAYVGRTYFDLDGNLHSEFNLPYSEDFQPISLADDNSSPVGNGFASARSGVVGAGESIALRVVVTNFSWGGPQTGDYALYIRLGVSDFTDFDPSRFDYRLEGSPFAAGQYQDFRIPGLTPGTPFIAWIDNTISPGTFFPDTQLELLGPTLIYYYPNRGFQGTDEFTYTLWSDDGRESSTAKVTVTVPSLPPVAEDDASATPKATPTTIDVLANDYLHFFQGDTLELSALLLGAGPAHGTVVIDPAGFYGPMIVYTPHPGFQGEDRFTYQVRDDEGTLSNLATVVLTVGSSPVADDVITRTQLDTPVTIAVLDYVFDPDGTVDPSSLALDASSAHGTATIEQTEFGPVLVYTPDLGFSGEDSFTYRVRDNDGALSDPFAVLVTVGNTPPLADDGFFVGIPENTPTDLLADFTLIANVFDLDGSIDFSTLAVTAPPTRGTLVLQETAPGSFELLYTPEVGFLGTDTFNFTVRDNDGALSNEATVYVDVFDVAPFDDEATTAEDVPVAIDVLANDEGSVLGLDPATLAITSGPLRGTASVEPTTDGAVIVYTPPDLTGPALVVDDPRDVDDGDYRPGKLSLREAIKLANADGYTETFRYTVLDVAGNPTNEATVTVTVTPGHTTITFAPNLTRRGPVTLGLSRIGDTSEGSSALAITSPITIVGPTGSKGITLAGPGSTGDLRLFLVATGGDLTLQNLKLTRGATDSSGGALHVQGGASATLVNCTLTNNFAFENGGAIYSWGTLALTACTLSGNQANQGGGLNLDFGTATIVGTTFANNSAAGRGGGFYNSSTPVTLSGSKLIGNTAHEGGGFFNSGIADLTNCVISSNSADAGGGFDNAYLGTVVQFYAGLVGVVSLTGSTISGNTANQGGGFRNLSTANLTDSTVAGNQATQGGGIYSSKRIFDFNQETRHTNLTLTRSTVANNQALTGGGLYLDRGSAILTDSTFSINSARTSGGGIYNDGQADLTNATLAGNSAKIGGGIYSGFGLATIVSSTLSANTARQGGGLYNDLGLVTLISTIVAGNRNGTKASDIAGTTPVNAADSIFNLIGTGGSGGLLNGAGGNLVGANPLLAKLGNYGGPVQTLALLPGSLALDAGNGDAPDARGVTPVGTKDIGAFESRGFTLAATGSGQSAQRNKAFGKPLKVKVTAVSPVEPVVGGIVTFTPPVDGATAKLSASQVTIPASRTVSVTAKANGSGGTYEVLATTGAADPATFTLTNLGPIPLTRSISEGLPGAATIPASGAVATQVQTTEEAPPAYTTLPADLAEYRLDAAGKLSRRLPSEHWEVIARDVLSFRKAPNGDLYVLTDDHELKRLQLGYSWTTLHGSVETFEIDAYGTLFVLDTASRMNMFWAFDRYYVLPPIPAGFSLIALDPPSDFEVVEAAGMNLGHHAPKDEFNDIQYFAPGPEFPLSRELDVLLEANDLLDENGFHTNYDYFPPNLPARELGVRSPFNNIRMVKEKITDSLEPPRYFPGVGWAQLHRAQYKCTIYYSSLSAQLGGGGLVGEDEQQIIYISHDHLHQYVPGSAPPLIGNRQASSPPAAANLAGAEGEARAAAATGAPVQTFPGPAVQRREDNFVQSLTMSADGTLYRLGEAGDGWFAMGSETGPYFLWRLPANSLWQPIDYVYSYSVAPDNALLILNRRHELRSLPAGSSEWTTLATDVRSFHTLPDGTHLALGLDGVLRRMASGSEVWTTLDTGVESFAMTPKGVIFALTDRQELKGLTSQAPMRTLDTGVESFAMTEDGAVYALNGRGEFKRWRVLSQAQTLATGIRSYQVTLKGDIYALTTSGVLQQLTPRDHWTVLATGVRTFQFAPNGDLYLINDQHELRRQKLGYFWQTLQTDVESFTIYSDGVVYVRDSQQVTTHYASLGPYFVLPPLGSGVPAFALDPPSDNEVFLAANFVTGIIDLQYFAPGPEFPLTREPAAIRASGDGEGAVEVEGSGNGLPFSASRRKPAALRYSSIALPIPELLAISDGRIVKELILDRVDPPRFFPGIGLAQMHHALYRCTFYFGTHANPDNQLVLYIDHDHLHMVGNVEAE